MKLDKPEGKPDDTVGWGSDIAAAMLRRFNIPYVSLNPGASYRGLHDFARQSSRQRAPRHPRLPARGSFGLDRARLRARHRRADGLRAARQCRPLPRHDGHLQRVVRPPADAGARRHRSRRHREAPPVDRLDPHDARSGRARARLRQMGRPADLGRRSRRVARACASDHAHSTHRARLCLPRRGSSGREAREGHRVARSCAAEAARAAASREERRR